MRLTSRKVKGYLTVQRSEIVFGHQKLALVLGILPPVSLLLTLELVALLRLILKQNGKRFGKLPFLDRLDGTDESVRSSHPGFESQLSRNVSYRIGTLNAAAV